jgi:hypothetical protein
VKLLWIEVQDEDRADRHAELLEAEGTQADVAHNVRGVPEVRIRKPRLRRMEPFLDDIEAIVARWLEEDSADESNVVLRTIDEVFELQNPRARAPFASAGSG